MKTLALSLLLTCAMPAPMAFARDGHFETMTTARAAYDSGDWDRALGLYAKVYEEVEGSDPLKAEAALEWSSILWERGEYGAAKKRAEEALELAKKFKLDNIVGRLLVNLGHIEASQGQLSRARKTFELCASMSGENEDPVFGAVCRMNLSLIDRMRGKKGMSDAELQRDIALLESAKSPLAAGSALARSADLYAKNKDHASALLMLQKAQGQFAAAGSVPAQARNRIRIAQVMQDSGDFDGAKKQLELARGPLVKMNNRPALVNTYGLLGRDAQQRGQRADAVGHYNRSLSLAESIRNPQLIAQSHLALCEAMANPTPVKGVDHHCKQADERFGKLRMPDLQVRAMILRGTLAQARGHEQEARTAYMGAIKLLEKSPKTNLDTLAVQYANLCQVDYKLNVTGTLKTCTRGLEKLRALENSAAYTEHIAATYYIAGFAAQGEKRIKQALRYFEQAAIAYMKLETPERVRAADARLRMGIIYSAVLEGESQAEQSFRAGITLLDGHDGLQNARIIRAQLHQQLIQLHAEKKDWAQVLTASEELVAYGLASENKAATGWAYNYLAQAKLKTGDRQGAITALQAGVDLLEGVASEKELRAMMKKSLKSLTK